MNQVCGYVNSSKVQMQENRSVCVYVFSITVGFIFSADVYQGITVAKRNWTNDIPNDDFVVVVWVLVKKVQLSQVIILRGNNALRDEANSGLMMPVFYFLSSDIL